jgi:two-component system phosphate regulon sensor histidine kinase PhoR
VKRKQWFSPFVVIIPAIMAAALVLGYLSYSSAVQLAQRSERSVERSNRALGLKLIDRIEKVIIDSDRTLFQLVNLDDPREFRELWRRIVRVSPAVESVTVLGEDRRVIHLIAKLAPSALRHFRKTLESRILPDMALGKLPPNKHKHLHKAYEGVYYLMSYIRRRSEGRDYFIALNINLPYIIREIFREEFRELEDSNSIAVTDAEGRVVYGTPVALVDPLLFEARFPTTLYKWRLQIAPRQMQLLARGARRRRLSDLVLVGSAVSVIWVGLIVLFVAMRKERRANQLKSEFVSNVSHELKTPLSLIRMFGELLALGRAKDDETKREYAQIIARESERLTSQIDNVLDFARIERGREAYTMRVGDMGVVIEKVVELFRYRTDQAGVDLRVDVPQRPVLALHDESAMTLLLLNLVENAFKYGTQTGGFIGVSLQEKEGLVFLRVEDDGPGIARDETQRVFERFYRGREARRSEQRGSGIGLSLVQHIAQAHGGRARVVPRDVGGAMLEVSIPGYTSDDEDCAEPDTADAEGMRA